MLIKKQKSKRLVKCILFFAIVVFFGCAPKREINPPVTSPLSRYALGYGVVTASYTRVFSEPGYDGVSLGYVREKTILSVLERRLVNEGEEPQFWVYTEGDYRGWLPESVIKIYNTERRAQTAASR